MCDAHNMRQRERESDREREGDRERAKVFSGLTIGFMVQCRRNVRIFHCGLCTPPPPQLYPLYDIWQKENCYSECLCVRVCVCASSMLCILCVPLVQFFTVCAIGNRKQVGAPSTPPTHSAPSKNNIY